MIPSIEEILSMLLSGQCTEEQASAWINRHLELAELPERDYFAAKALSGLCANPQGPFQANPRSGWGLVNCTMDTLALESYAMADAMLKARAQ